MSRKIIFIENDNHVDCALDLIDEQTCVIALQSSCQSRLKKENIPYYSSIDFLKQKDHHDIEDLLSDLVVKVKSNFVLHDFYGYKDAYNSNFDYYLQAYVYYWAINTKVVIRAFEKLKPSSVMAPFRDNFKNSEPMIGTQSSFIGEMVKQISVSKKIKYSFYGGRNKLRNSSLKFTFFKRFFFTIQLKIYSLATSGREVIYANNDSYNLTRVVDFISQNTENSIKVYSNTDKKLFVDSSSLIFARKFWRFFFLPQKSSHRNINHFARSYQSSVSRFLDSQPKNYFNYYGVDIFNAISNYISSGLMNGLMRLNSEIENMHKIFNIKSPKIIASVHSLGIGSAQAEYSSVNTNTKSLLISHGSVVRQNAIWKKKAWEKSARFLIDTNYEYIAIQTYSNQAFLRKQKSNHISKKILTGPLIFSQKNKLENPTRQQIFRSNSSKIIFLHAATPRPFGSYIPGVFETPDEYIKSVNELIGVFKNVKNAFLAIRIRPKGFIGLSESDINSLLEESDSYGVYSDGSFEDYLINSDYLISFSSTAIEEGLANKIPVIQFDSGKGYEHIKGYNYDGQNRTDINQEIFYVNNSVDMQNLIEKISDQKIINSTKPLKRKYFIPSKPTKLCEFL